MPTKEVAAQGGRGGSILSEELIDAVAELIRKGNYIDRACAAAGISKEVYRAWLKQGGKINRQANHRGISIEEMADGDPILIMRARFARAILRASAQAEDKDVARIDRHADDDWRAAAWRLERRFPKRWGQRKLEITGAEGGPLQWSVLVAAKNTGEKPALPAGGDDGDEGDEA